MQFFDALDEILCNDNLRKAIIERYLKITQNHSYNGGYQFIRYEEDKMYEDIPNLIKAFPEKDLYDNWKFYRDLANLYGIENAKDFITESSRSLITLFISLS